MKKKIKRIWVSEDLAKSIKKLAIDRNKKQIELEIQDINSSIKKIPINQKKVNPKKLWKFQI